MEDLSKQNVPCYMTDKQIRYAYDHNELLPDYICVQPDQLWQGVNLTGIHAPHVTMEINNCDFSGRDLNIKAIHIKNKKPSMMTRVHSCTLEDLKVENTDKLDIFDVDGLDFLEFDKVRELAVKKTHSLTGLTTSSFDRLELAKLQDVPNLKSSEAINVVRQKKKASEIIYLRQEDRLVGRKGFDIKDKFHDNYRDALQNCNDEMTAVRQELEDLENNKEAFLERKRMEAERAYLGIVNKKTCALETLKSNMFHTMRVNRSKAKAFGTTLDND